MAVINRQSITIDADDIKYLKQFPTPAWGWAFLKRYNDFLFDALNGEGNIRPEWSDVRIVSLGDRYGKFKVDTGITKVVKKLKGLGYDFRGMNSVKRVAPYFTPMRQQTAYDIIYKLKKTDPNYQSLGPGKTPKDVNPTPDALSFNLAQAFTRRDDPEPTEEKTLEMKSNFHAEWPKIEEKGRQLMMSYDAQTNANPNITWWQMPQHLEEFINTLHKRAWQRWNVLKGNSSEIKKFIGNEIVKALQGGMVARRGHQALVNKHGFDVKSLLRQVNPDTGKPWTPLEIQDVYKNSASYEDMLDRFGHNRQRAKIA